MGANALGALRLLLAGVADQFDMLIGLLAVQGIKGVIGQIQGFGKRAQHGNTDLRHRALPAQQRRFQVR